MVFCSKWCSAQSGVLLNLGGVLLKVVFCSESGVVVNTPRGAKGVLCGVVGQHIIGLRCTATVLYIVYEPNTLY